MIPSHQWYLSMVYTMTKTFPQNHHHFSSLVTNHIANKHSKLWKRSCGQTTQVCSPFFLGFYLCFSAVGYAKARSSIWPWFYYVLSFGMPKSKSDSWKPDGLYSWLYFEIPETDVRSAAQIRSGGHFYSQIFKSGLIRSGK